MNVRGPLCVVLLVSGLAAGAVFVPDGKLRPDDYTVLMAADAKLPAGLAPIQSGAHGKFFVAGWRRPEQFFTWQVEAPADDAYAVNVLLKSHAARPLELKVRSGAAAVTGTSPADVRVWTRQALEGTLPLSRGAQTLVLDARSAGGTPEFEAEFLSIELVRPAVRERLAEAAVKSRADTKWLQDAGYGIMCHWTSQTMPRHGERKAYAQAVRDFDVSGFVAQIRDTGAGFLVLATSHAEMYFPAPIAALERALPGRTAARDLVAELADALGARGIRLILYYHIGAIDDPAWLEASGFWKTDTSRIFGTWEAVIGEVGERYGAKLAGYWFDDGTINYYYRSAPWERLTRTARKGNPNRLVAYNPWELPSCTAFQDYFTGEGYGDPAMPGLPLGPDGRFTGGSHAGLQACATLVTEGDWVHGGKETEVGAPRYDAAALARLCAAYRARKIVPIFNLEIYQEGAVSARTVAVFREARAR